MTNNNNYNGLEIAIIGLSGKFPESADHRQYWQHLKAGKEMIKTFTGEELLAYGLSEEELANESYIRSEGVIGNKDHFDAGFFGYTAAEAALMDPQIRLFHEQCWSALEDAGYASAIETSKIGIFAGASTNDSWKMYTYNKAGDAAIDPFYLTMIRSQNFISTLVAYKLNLRGPAFYVDTACSTSLVAVHLACRSLLTRDCKIALAGGVSVKTIKRKGYVYEEGMIFSKDGHCRAFDADSSGTVAGEGAGVVVLKRLSEAVNDGDHIYAVIRSSAINNDGSNKVSYTAPSVKGQTECIVAAQKIAGIDPRSISYVETHGTATLLGDPIEVRALNIAFNSTNNGKYCAIGSVKTNMGHLDAAAGVSGLIKTALSLKHKQLPASLHYVQPNPEIDFNGGPFYVNKELKEWKRTGDLPLRAGVSSFGIGGTNAHLILEEAPEAEVTDSGKTYKLLVLSAKTESALARYVDKLHVFLREQSAINLADMAYTLQVGRKSFDYRKAVTFSSDAELMELFDSGKLKEQFYKTAGKTGSVVFMFSGAGSQYVNMGKDLYETENIFRQEIDKGFGLLKKITGEDYKSILYPASINDLRVNHMLHTQPAIFLFEYALAQLLMNYGVKPEYLIGHSIGEYVAACISGVFSYEDALKLVIKRGELMYSMSPGAMVSAAINEKEALEYTTGNIAVAAVNGAEQVVFSGDVVAVDELLNKFEALDIQFVKLHTSHAGHSPMIENILEDYKKELESVIMNSPEIPFVSNVTGNFITVAEATSVNYWLKHMRNTVKFSDGIKTLLAVKDDKLFIEVGAGHSLTSSVKQYIANAPEHLAINLVRSIKENENDQKYFIENIGRLWSNGVQIEWAASYKEEKRSRLSLPAYSFEPTTFPAEVDPFESLSLPAFNVIEPANNKELKDWIYYPAWKTAAATGSDQSTELKSYLLFDVNDKRLSALKKKLLVNKQEELIEITGGETFIKHSRKKYTINNTQTADFKQLLAALQNDGITITDIIYGGGISSNTPVLELDKDNKNIHAVYFSLVKLIQELRAANALSGKRIVVLTDSLHNVAGNEKIAYVQAPLLGLVNALPQEYSVSCCNIDIRLSEKDTQLTDILAREIRTNTGPENRVVAIRYGKRWIKEYQKNKEAISKQATLLKQGGVYLITGGLGNVGFILAKFLIENYNAKLILTGRRRTDDELAINNSSETWLKKLSYLKSLSTEVTYLSTDITDIKSFKAAIETIEGSVGNINGIIHTAGVTDYDEFELVEDITYEKTFHVFAAKVKGLENIYTLFKERKPDFVWATSSLASVLAGLSFASYSAANLYMEHFITSKAKELPNWKCVGLAEMVFEQEHVAIESNQPMSALKPDEISALFEWSLSVKDFPVVLETATELSARIHQVYGEKKAVYLDNDIQTQPAEKALRPNLKNAYVPPKTQTEEKLKELFQHFFGITDLGIEDDFFDLGGDSLKAMVLLRRIRQEFDTEVTLKEFLTDRKISGIAACIDEKKWINKVSEKKYSSVI